MSINLYPIKNQLGEGGFGTTYLATNTLMPSRPDCVVKQLVPTSKDPRVQQTIQDRFRQEAITLENLSNGSNGRIPILYHYFAEHGEFYLVQEYIDGQTLTDKVRSSGRFTEIQVRQLLTDILQTLSYVHQKGIIHRDIKPDNIMVRYSDDKPVLIDFGAVKEIMSTVMTASANTGGSIVIGTPGFMPVEQMSGRPTFASDIYSLGLTAIYLLTGKMPTEIETDSHSGNINWQIYTQNVSPQLQKVLNKSIEPVLGHRYTNTQEMLQDLNNQGVTNTVVAPIPKSYQEQYSNPPQQSQQQYNQSTQKGNTQTNPILMAIIGVVFGGGLVAVGLGLANIFSPQPSVMLQPPPPTTPTIPPTPTPSSISQTSLLPKDNLPVQQLNSFYFVNDSAFPDLDSAKNKLKVLQSRDYNRAGIFWIPDYPNLSGKKLFGVYAAKFNDRQSCANFIRSYRSSEVEAYCAFASKNKNDKPDRF